MGSCDSIKNQISDYLEKRLEPSARSQVEHHLEQCPHCYQVAERIPAVQALMANLEMAKCSTDFSLALRQKISANSGNAFDSQRLRRYSLALSFAVILIVAGLGINGMLFDETTNAPVASSPPSISTASSTPINVQPVNPALVDYQDLLGGNEEIDIKMSESSKSPYSDSLNARHYNSNNPRVKYVDDSNK